MSRNSRHHKNGKTMPIGGMYGDFRKYNSFGEILSKLAHFAN